MALDERRPLSDELLDEGLQQYGQILSRPGLEGRILATMRVEKQRRVASSWQRWAFPAGALAVATALAIFIVWRPSTKAPEIGHAGNSPRLVTPGGAIVGRVIPHPRQVRKSRKRIVPTVVAHGQPEQFPSPRPLSSQEELLLAYVTQNPVREVMATARKTSRTEHLHIQDLELAPLHVDQLETAENQ